MDLQTRKIEFIQEFLKIANGNLLEKFEHILAMEREKKFNEKIKPQHVIGAIISIIGVSLFFL